MLRSGSRVIGIVWILKYYYHLRFVQQVIGDHESLLKSLMYRDRNIDIILSTRHSKQSLKKHSMILKSCVL